jgi:hypothetical protein
MKRADFVKLDRREFIIIFKIEIIFLLFIFKKNKVSVITVFFCSKKVSKLV